MRKPHFRIPSKHIPMEDRTLHSGNGGGKWTGAYEQEQKNKAEIRECRYRKNKGQDSTESNAKDYRQYREI